MPYKLAKFTLFSGPVKSRKTFHAVRVLNSARASGFKHNGNFLVVKHPMDDVGSPGKIGGHEAYVLEHPNGIAELITDETRAILISGISHFKKEEGIVDLVDSLVRSGRNVIGYGLNLDSEGWPYGSMADLMAISDDVKVLKAICGDGFCELPAGRSIKIDRDYEPRCVTHFSKQGGRPRHGKLMVKTGPMYVGKTTTLGDLVAEEELRQNEFMVFNYAADNRYSETGKCATHDRAEFDSIGVTNGQEVYDRVIRNPNVKTVFIDESQFIGLKDEPLKGLYMPVHNLLSEGYDIVVFGLARTYNRKRFGETSALMCLADEVEVMYGICVDCKNHPSTESQRMIHIKGKSSIPAPFEGEIEVVGGAEDLGREVFYRSVCLRDLKFDGASYGDNRYNGRFNQLE
ncbi:hypothetical protein J4216_02370 [Candidatus Woesearchaeota archaeon]|nr:hypothetical protein [Candidatus Woesearchaeota archaeon]